MVGRNEKCPCGSGMKYKHCHLNSEMKPSYHEVAKMLSFDHKYKEIIYQTFFAIQDDFMTHQNPGACHLISGIMYILLKEQGVESSLCIGEVQRLDKLYFDHSWIEIDNKVFDIAIQLTFDEKRNAPIFAGYDLSSSNITDLNYRFHAEGLGGIALKVRNSPFNEYMDGAPRNLSWGAVERIGRHLHLKFDRNTLRHEYKNTQRILVTP